MLILWVLFVAASAAQKVIESTEDIGPEAFENITTLYPIPHNNTYNKTVVDKTLKQNIINDLTHNIVAINESNSKEDKLKSDATIWKIDAGFAESNLDDKHIKENVTKDAVDKNNYTKEFRPSPHLGNFYDEDSVRITPTRASSESFTPVRKPSSGFVSSSEDEYRSSITKIPNHILQTHKQYPYKFESPVLTRLKDPWRQNRPDILESRPTVGFPVKVPAGGFYKYEDPFREKPEFPEKTDDGQFKVKPENNDDDFKLGFTEDGRDADSAVKKRVDPWQSFLRVVTAFLPVGLIISALTPSLVTIQPAGTPPHSNTYPANVFRRSDADAAQTQLSALPVISERCRRRLLCELHSDMHYQTEKSPVRRGVKPCYKIKCEDSEALSRTLQWLLHYRQSQNRHNT